MKQRILIFVLVLPILIMIEYSFAIGGAPRNDEIIARIDLIKVPNFNLWLPRLSLYNCYAWWLDHRMFDSSNVEIIIPAALNVPFSIKDRPFYLYELKHHYQIYLSCMYYDCLMIHYIILSYVFSITIESSKISGTYGPLCWNKN